MTTKQAQHLVPGDRVQTLLGVHQVLEVDTGSAGEPGTTSGLVSYFMRNTITGQVVFRRSMPEWKVETV